MMGPFVFIGTPMISPLYRMFYGCQALTTGVSPHELNRAITGLNGFTFWATSNPRSDGVIHKTLAFVRRDGIELERLQRRMSARLLSGRFVLEPLLCYFVATLGMVKAAMLTGDVVKAMFKFVIRRPLETLSIVTKDGIKRMSAGNIADMTVSWLVSLAEYIHHNSRATESLDMADRCYQTYMTQCRNGDSDSNDMDPSGEVAKGMLTTNRENSQLFLGIRSSELQKLYKYLVQLMPGSVPGATLTYLRHVSESYIDRD
ncbi:hypothetical protein GGI22_003234 [Coemansia erecta]|nr:hypothetical protein GGI22_003234 [Coemansia erecta]